MRMEEQQEREDENGVAARMREELAREEERR